MTTPPPTSPPPTPVPVPPQRSAVMVADAAPRQAGLRRRIGSSFGRIATGLVAGVVVTLSLGLVIFVFGRVSGREFAPSHFRMRGFSFYEFPLLGVQVTPIRRWDITPDIASRLSATAWISRPNTPPQTWHLVSLSRGSTAVRFADAELLTRFLEYEPVAASIDSRNWLSWSRDHSDVANLLWPQVQKLANEELYLFIPELFAIARRADDAAAAARQIERFLDDQYAELANDLREAGQTELAAEILRQSRSIPVPEAD